ncbi:MAG: hypothetical protein GQ527_04810 [Bacteroidales bacterium]|nr:hypothetical protein [Bacteroidales bacterium]
MKKLFIIILIGVVYSCDGPYKNCDEYYFSDEYKAYTVYQEGSYWIYKDTINNETDSVYLKAETLYLVDECDYNTEFEERLIHAFYSSFFIFGNDNIIEGSAFLKNYNDHLSPPMGIYSDQFGDKLDSLEVNNIWYQDIKVFELNGHKYYWAKHIGIIKKTIPYPLNGSTIYYFDLLRYHLE